MPHTAFKLKAFRRWAREARYGEDFVYHREPHAREPELFDLARKYSDVGVAFLWSRRLDDGRIEKIARRTSIRAHVALDKIGATTQVERTKETA